MLDKAEDYLIRSGECVVLGNFTDEVTVLGVAGQFAMGFFDLDMPCDIRDIIADVKNLAQADEIKWDMIAMLALDLIGVIPVIGALKYSDEIGTLFKNADKVSVVARSTDGTGVLAKHADEAGAWLHGVKVFRYSDETAEAVASGEKLLKESGTIYESFADMMSPEDAKRYLDFLENGSREGLTSAELAGVEKADALLVSRKVGYEDVWDLRNVGDVLESGSKSGSGSKFQEVFDLADNYTLSDDTFDNHILDRHGPNSTYGNKSHFNADFDIRNGIDSTLTGDNFIVGPNTAGREGYIFEQTFSNPIGTNSKGKPLYTLKVVIDEAGNVITAFPKK